MKPPPMPTIAETLLAHVEQAATKRVADMPTERDAIVTLFCAWLRLKELGWAEAMYAPDGVDLEIIECGSTGIHGARRDNSGRFWIDDAGDSWPSNPVLYRLKDAQERLAPPEVGRGPGDTTEDAVKA